MAVGDTSGRAFVNSLLHCKYLRRNLVAGTCKDLEGKVPGFLRLRDCLYETRTALAAERQQWLHPLQARYARPFPLHLCFKKHPDSDFLSGCLESQVVLNKGCLSELERTLLLWSVCQKVSLGFNSNCLF